MTKRLLFGVYALLVATPSGHAQEAAGVRTVRLINHFGSIQASVNFETELSIRAESPARPLVKGDTVMTEEPGSLTIECKPRDGATVNLDVAVPFGINLEIETKSGAISLRGMFAKASLSTVDGAIRITAPWKATRLVMTSAVAPRSLDASPEVAVTQRRGSAGDQPRWELRDKLSPGWPTFGAIEIKAQHPGDTVLADMPVPEEAPVRFPWQAPEAIEAILRGGPPQQAHSRPAAAASSDAASAVDREGFVFRSDVRMVNLTVSVTEPDGQPTLDLLSDEFEIAEDGVHQKIAAFSSEEAPFNLVLLLDLSDSTFVERSAMKESARRFIGSARPSDRVAVYVLANNRVVVVSSLTSDHAKLLELLEQIPGIGGGSPLYDAIALAYERELHRRPGERNALLVITDGLDNGLRPPRFQQQTALNERVLLSLSQGMPSQTSFPDLKRAIARMEALLYVVFLEDAAQGARLPSEFAIQARKNLKELAEISAGRLFTAKSVLDWDPVYEVANELRSLYSVAYHPTNQNFDGGFRKVKVKVRDAAAVVRARERYYAK